MDVTRSGGVRRRRGRVRDPEISWEQCRPPPAFRNGRVRADGGKDQILVSGSEKRRGGNGCREGEEGSASPSPQESNLAICHVKHCSRSSFAKEWSAQEGRERGSLSPLSLLFMVYGPCRFTVLWRIPENAVGLPFSWMRGGNVFLLFLSFWMDGRGKSGGILSRPFSPLLLCLPRRRHPYPHSFSTSSCIFQSAR